jgi:hypothetical protein
MVEAIRASTVMRTMTSMTGIGMASRSKTAKPIENSS